MNNVIKEQVCPSSRWFNFFKHDSRKQTGFGQEPVKGDYILSGDGMHIRCLGCQFQGRMDTPEGDKIIDGECHKS